MFQGVTQCVCESLCVTRPGFPPSVTNSCLSYMASELFDIHIVSK